MKRMFNGESSEFLRLSDGKEFIRKFEVVGLRWKSFTTVDEERSWGLQVYFSDAPYSTFYGEDAAAIMKAFSLPEDPPAAP